MNTKNKTILPMVFGTTVPALYLSHLFIMCIFLFSDAQMSTKAIREENSRKIKVISEDAATLTVSDARGKEITLAKHPQRVLPVYTSYLNVWYECGGTAIGRPTTESAELNENALSLPEVGHVTNPNMEKVLSLKPDLILMRYGFPGHARLIPMLEQAKISFLTIRYETFEDYTAIVDVFTRITGRDDIRTDSLSAMQVAVEAIKARCRAARSPRVLILFGSSMGVTVQLPNTLVGSIIHDFNAQNIAWDANLTSNEMQIFSMERVVERDPEVILIQTMGNKKMVNGKIHSEIESNPAWKTLSAVKYNRIHYLPVNNFLYKPNRHFPDAYAYLEMLLYPQGSK